MSTTLPLISTSTYEQLNQNKNKVKQLIAEVWQRVTAEIKLQYISRIREAKNVKRR